MKRNGGMSRRILAAVVLGCLAGATIAMASLGEGGFKTVRRTADGILIGKLPEDARIGSWPCRKGWVHLYDDETPAAFTAADTVTLARLTVPTGTWVRCDRRGVVELCAFPQDTEVQGHLCRGTGGSKGVQVAFYPDGALRQFYPPRPVRIDGVWCDSGLRNGWVELHANGRLKSCRLAEDLVRGGLRTRRGQRVEFDPEGRLLLSE